MDAFVFEDCSRNVNVYTEFCTAAPITRCVSLSLVNPIYQYCNLLSVLMIEFLLGIP